MDILYNLMVFEFGEGQGKERAKVLIEALNLYVKLKYKIENYKTEQADLIERLKLKEYDTETEKEYAQNRLYVVNAILKDLLKELELHA